MTIRISTAAAKNMGPFLIELLAIKHGIPEPNTEYRFHPKRKWRFDFAWVPYKVALEVEGGAFTQGRHTRGKGFIADMEKYNEATILGWRILRCTPQQLNSGAAFALVRRMVDSLRGES